MNDASVREVPASPVPPRLIPQRAMRDLVDAQQATTLTDHERYRMFVRYDNTWWIGYHDTYCEITSEDNNRKLDTWRRRLTEGALWH